MAIAVKVVSDSTAARADLSKLQGSVDKIGTTVEGVTKQFKDMASTIAATLVSVGTITQLVSLNDTMKSISSQLKVSTDSAEDFNFALKSTREIAMSTGGALKDITDLYSKVSMSAENLGATQEDVAQVVSNVAKSIASGNASLQQTNSAVLQLGQALGSGMLAGDELKSLMENSVPLVKNIATGLGVSVSQLKQMGAAGELTSQRVFGALLVQTNAINGSFAKMEMTFSKSMQKMSTALNVLFASFMDMSKDPTAEGGGGILGYIEKMSNGIFNFAKNLKQSFLDTQGQLMYFSLEMEDTFRGIAASIKKGFGDVGISIGEVLDSIPSKLSDALRAAKSFVTMAFSGIKFDIQPIQLDKFIPNLFAMGETVWRWVRKVADAFKWLLDDVITHSSFTDLIKGIKGWIDYLNEGPLKSIVSFTTKVGEAFQRLTDKVLAVPFVKKFVDNLREAWIYLNKMRGMQDLKQIFGIKDKVGGTYADRTSPDGVNTIDTNGYVGRGPRRGKENRPFLHDITNALKGENQVPFLATIANVFGAGLITAVTTGSVIKGVATMFGMGLVSGIGGAVNSFVPIGISIAGAIVAAMTGGPLVKGLVFALTTALGTIVVKDVSSQNIAMTAENTMSKIWEGINKLFSMVFGDKGITGILLMMAKIALLFRSGREAIGRGLGGIATAPISAMNNLTTRADRRMVESAMRRNAEQRASLSPQGVARQHTEAMQRYNAAINSLVGKTDAYGRIIDQTRANAIGTSLRGTNLAEAARQLSRLSVSAGVDAARARSAGGAIDAARAMQQNQAANDARIRELRDANRGLQQVAARLDTRIQEARANLRQGVQNTLVGGGGAIGTVMGFELGSEFIKGMEGSSAWAKIATQIGFGIGGQAIGAAIGGAISVALIASVGFLTSPITLALATGGLLLWAVFDGWFKKDWFKTSFDNFINRVSEQIDRWMGIDPEKAAQNKQARKELDAANKKISNAEKIIENKDTPTAFKNDAVKTLELAAKEREAAGNKLTGWWENILGFGRNFVDGQRLRKEKESGVYDPRVTDTVRKKAEWGDDLKPSKLFTNLLGFITGSAQASEDPSDKVFRTFNAFETPKVDTKSIMETSSVGRLSVGKITPIGTPTVKDEIKAATTSISTTLASDFDKLVAAIRSVESGGDPNAKSHKGALGSMQIMPKTFDDYKKPGELITVEADRVAAAMRKIRADLEYYGGDIKRTAAAYIGGRGAVTHNGKSIEEGGKPTSDGIIRTDINDGAPGKKGNTPQSYAELVVARFSKAGGDATKAIDKGASVVKDKATSFFDGLVDTMQTGADALGLGVDIKAQIANLKRSFAVLSKPQIPGNSAAKAATALGVDEQPGGGFSGSDLVGMEPMDIEKISAFDSMDTLEKVNEALAKLGYDSIDAEKLTDDNLGVIDVIKRNIITMNDSFKIMNDKSIKSDSITKRLAKRNYNMIGAKITEDMWPIRVKKPGEEAPFKPSAIAGTDGKSYATSLNGTLTGAISNVLKGKAEENKGFFKRLAEGFTNSVIDGFSKGLVTNFMEASNLNNVFIKLITGTSGLGENGGGKVGDSAKGIFGSILDAFKGNDKESNATGNIESDADGINKAISGSGAWEYLPKEISGMTDTVVNGITDIGNLLRESNTFLATAFRSIFGMMIGGDIKDPKFDTVGLIFKAIGTAIGIGGAGSAADAVTATSSAGDSLSVVGSNGFGQSMSLPSGIAGGMSTSTSWTNSLSSNLTMEDLARAARGYAVGGSIWGAGTGTSDSIPVMASNGEFITNAKQSAKFRPLLEAINKDRMPRFADGGFVDSSQLTAMELTASEIRGKTAGSSVSSSTFNINITGDINRQTRNEIVKMMPMIASGVNMQNQESGYKS